MTADLNRAFVLADNLPAQAQLNAVAPSGTARNQLGFKEGFHFLGGDGLAIIADGYKNIPLHAARFDPDVAG
ncbi:hypothetical protein AC812_03040 [Bellilinea caldifistulae]|uniref:Uncharacterized protein n=1 Tax=Bellilinea caldifistulae TaxID=360411 RepID=A0A0P6XMD8_9CHLR|nr:hypothetical protein AC812_03040 [Bellilinea caldifistulae]